MAFPVPLDEPEAPPVVTWYRVYAGFMAVVYVLVAVGGAALMLFHQELGASNDPPPLLVWVYGGFLTTGGIVFVVPFVAAFLIPRAPWAWVYHMIMIGIGLTSPCCLPASLPLLFYWLKPEARAYFGRPPR